MSDGRVNLTLKSQSYFSKKPNDSIESLLMTGIEFDEFHRYLKEFVSFKKTTDEDAGGVVLDTNSNVVVITLSGRIVECKSMKEYILEYCPEMAPQPPAQSPPTVSTRKFRM